MTDAFERIKGKLVYAEDILDLFYVASVGQDKAFVEIVEDVVENTPEANAVEVVRCKDCKHCESCYPKKEIGKEAEIVYYCTSLDCIVKPDHFCSYGESNG